MIFLGSFKKAKILLHVDQSPLCNWRTKIGMCFGISMLLSPFFLGKHTVALILTYNWRREFSVAKMHSNDNTVNHSKTFRFLMEVNSIL